jgi:hypothetical protein
MNIPIPGNFVSTVASSTTTMIGSLGSVSTLIIGLLLAFLVLELVLRVLSPRSSSDEPVDYL